MLEATFLHIQGRDDSPTRVIELPIGPIRIGRGPLCEVRLVEPDLGDVQCMLRRRGTTWHYQPVGPPGLVWIDGRPADHQRPLPIGVPLRIGDHWLTLRSAERSSDTWTTFNAPTMVEQQAVEIDLPATEEPRTEPSTPERPQPATAETSDERLRRRQSRLDQREKWLKDRQDEKRWEARWKAAGESIRSRSTSPSTTPTPPPPPRPTPPPPASRPSPATPVRRLVEPRPAPSFRRIADPAPRPSPARVPIRPTPGPVSTPPPPVPLPTRRVEPTAPASRAMVGLPAPRIDWSGTRIEPITTPVAPPSSVPEAPTPVLEPIEESPVPETIAPPAIEVLEAPSPIEVAEGSVAEEDEEVLSGSELGSDFDLSTAAEPIVVGSEPPIDRPIDDPSPEPNLEPASEIERIPFVSSAAEGLSDYSTKALEFTPHPQDEIPFEAEPIEYAPTRSKSEWPSASTIFASQGVRGTARVPEPARPARRRTMEPSATDVLAPSSWTLPTWLGWFPTAAVVLVLGVGGLALSYEWTLDGMAANLAMKLVLRDEKAGAPTIDPSSLPGGGWWKSTAAHRAAGAMALSRAGDGEDRSAEIREIIEAARHASPLSSTTRFAIEPIPGPESEASVDLSHLGKSRDVITLTWAGRRLRQTGKVDASIGAYRLALEIAARARIQEIDAPSFDEDAMVHRYRLPRESLMGTVVSDMIRAGEWTHEQWIAALPETAAAPLIASRILLKAKNRPEADRLTDLSISRADAALPMGLDRAEHHAAVAEALAARLRWTDAAAQYNLAIEQSDNDPTRRRWWLNLAEVARRMNDDPTRARAIESAKAADSNDEITRRALKHQQTNPGLAARGDRP